MSIVQTAAPDRSDLPEKQDPEKPTRIAWWEAYPKPGLVALAFLVGVLVTLTIDGPDWLGSPRVGTPLVITTILLYRAIYKPAGRRRQGVLLMVAALLLGGFAAAFGITAFRKFGDVRIALFAAVFVSAIPAVMLVKIWREYRRDREAAQEHEHS